MTSVQEQVRSRTPVAAADFFAPVHFLLAALVVIWLGSGVGTVLLEHVPGAYRWAIAAVWIGVSLLNPRNAMKLASSVWPLVAFVAVVLIALPASDATGRAYLQSIAYVVVVYCLFSFYSAPGYHRYQKVIVGLILLDLAVVAVRTWLALDANPDISRYLATGNVYDDILVKTADVWAVGGYPFAYALPAILLVFLHRAISGKRHRVVSWVVVGLGTVLLVRMSFTIAVMMWVAFGLLLVAGETIGRRHQSRAVLIGLLGIPVGILLAPPLLSFIARVGGVPEVIAIRLQEVATLLSGELGSSSDLRARLEQYGTSLQVLGQNWVSGSAGSGLGMRPVGTHSAWLDTFGAFGLPSLLFFTFLILAFRCQLSSVAGSERFVLKVAWTYFAVLGFVNTLLFAQLVLVWFVLLPFLLQADGRSSPDDRQP